MSSTVEVPVLIVGGGPAGLAASLLLSRHGVVSLLVERRDTPSVLPRARNLHERGLEVLRACGVEQPVRDRELRVAAGVEWRDQLVGPTVREQLLGGPRPAQVSPCAGVAQAQDVLEQVLREQAETRAGAQLRFGTELESFVVREDGIEGVLHQRSGGARTAVRARFLIAADGVRSGVREQLGIALDGDADLGRRYTVGFRADLTPWTGVPARGVYFLRGGSVLFPTHPGGRWQLGCPDAGSPDAATGSDPVERIRRAVGVPDLDVEVITEGRWTAVARSAQRYGQGPVFLVGDAAHQVPPAGGTGIGTAFQDVHNLAWKLAFVLDGRAGDPLLATYLAEREPVGRRNVAETRAAWLALRDPCAVQFAGRSLRQIDLGYRYESTAVIGDGSPDRDMPGEYLPVADPGCRAPHLWLDGGTRSTLDLFDRDLVLLTAPGGDGWAAQVPDGVVHHEIREPPWPALYGVGPGGAVLVRPDGHVAWRVLDLPGPGAEPAAELLRAVTCSILGTERVGASRRSR